MFLQTTSSLVPPNSVVKLGRLGRVLGDYSQLGESPMRVWATRSNGPTRLNSGQTRMNRAIRGQLGSNIV